MDPSTDMEELHSRLKKWIRLKDYHKTLAATRPQENKDKGGRSNHKPDFKRSNDRGQDIENVVPRGNYTNCTSLSISQAKVYSDVMNIELQDRPPPF